MSEDKTGKAPAKAEPAFPETRHEDACGRIRWDGKPKSLAEMDAGVLEEARRRYPRE